MKLWCVGANIFSLILLIASIGASYALPVFSLPVPTGAYSVGTSIFDVRFISEDNKPLPFLSQRPAIPLKLWYPADRKGDETLEPYMREAQKPFQLFLHERFGILPIAIDHFKYVKSNAVKNAAVSTKRRVYPMLLFCHGYAGFPEQFSILLEDLASRGYIVVGIPFYQIAPFALMQDGSILVNPNQGIYLNSNLWELATVVLDRMIDVTARESVPEVIAHIDFSRIGILGYSLGGTISLEALVHDDRIRAGLSLNGSLANEASELKLKKPFLFINSASALEQPSQRLAIQKMHENNAGLANAISIQGIGHLGFTDMLFWSPLMSSAVSDMLADFSDLTGTLEPKRGMEITRHCVARFFDATLKKDGPSRMSVDTALYPEADFYLTALDLSARQGEIPE